MNQHAGLDPFGCVPEPEKRISMTFKGRHGESLGAATYASADKPICDLVARFLELPSAPRFAITHWDAKTRHLAIKFT